MHPKVRVYEETTADLGVAETTAADSPPVTCVHLLFLQQSYHTFVSYVGASVVPNSNPCPHGSMLQEHNEEYCVDTLSENRQKTEAFELNSNNPATAMQLKRHTSAESGKQRAAGEYGVSDKPFHRYTDPPEWETLSSPNVCLFRQRA